MNLTGLYIIVGVCFAAVSLVLIPPVIALVIFIMAVFGL